MDFNINDIQLKLSKAVDVNDSYSIDDFTNEFNSTESMISLNKIQISLVNKSDNPDPDWETSGSSGFDLRASEYGSIKPNEFKVVPTGLYFDIPKNLEIQIRSRSGLAYKHGITVLNSPGTIDSDYTGEIGVILINHGKKTFNIAKGDRIAQGVIGSVMGSDILEFKKVAKIYKDTNRGDKGFGSTGIH